jgi:hypothetical protein
MQTKWVILNQYGYAHYGIQRNGRDIIKETEPAIDNSAIINDRNILHNVSVRLLYVSKISTPSWRAL